MIPPQEWNESFTFSRGGDILIKVWDSHPLMHKVFLGQAVVHPDSAPPPASAQGTRDVSDEQRGGNASSAMTAVAAAALKESAEQPARGKLPVYSAASHSDGPPSPSWVHVDTPSAVAPTAGDAMPAQHDEQAPARWYRLNTSDKHADEVHHRLERHGHAPDDLGELLVICESLGDTSSSNASGGTDTSRYDVFLLDDDVAGAPMADEYLHVDVAYGRNLLASDFNKGEVRVAHIPQGFLLPPTAA